MKRTHRYYLSFSSDTQQSNTSERERNRNLTDLFYFVLFLTYYSVECQTKSLSIIYVFVSLWFRFFWLYWSLVPSKNIVIKLLNVVHIIQDSFWVWSITWDFLQISNGVFMICTTFISLIIWCNLLLYFWLWQI